MEDDDQGPSCPSNRRKFAIEDDEVAHEVDVLISKNFGDNLFLLQYPLRPSGITHKPNAKITAQFKAKQTKLQLKCSIDTHSSNYDLNRGEQLAINSAKDSENPIFKKVMDHQLLISENIGGVHTGCYAIGFLKDNRLYLNPLKDIMQMKPSFHYLDAADEKTKSTKTGAPSNEHGNSSQDESEPEAGTSGGAQAVRVKFVGEESEAAKKRRLSSYAYMLKMQNEEKWIPLTYSGASDPHNEQVKDKFQSDTNLETTDGPAVSHDSKFLMRLFVPKAEEDETSIAENPSDVVSLEQLRKLPVPDQIQALMMNVKLTKYSQFIKLLPPEIDESTVLKGLQNCALLVQGHWIIKSELLYPRHMINPRTGTSGEVLARARDLCLYKFCQNPVLDKKDITSVVKIQSEDLQDILKQLAKFKYQRGWAFVHPLDTDFINAHADIVQKQATFWESKYQALCHQFGIKRSGSSTSPTRARHRTASRTHSQSAPGDEEKPTSLHKARSKDRAPTLNGSIDDKSHESIVSSEPNEAVLTKLRNFLYEQFSTKPALTLSDMKRHLLLRLAESPPDDILNNGVTDDMLEKSALFLDATKIQHSTMKEPVYVYTGDSLSWSDVRKTIVNILKDKPRTVVRTIKKACEVLDQVPDDTELRKIIFDYCIAKNSVVQLIGFQ